MSAFSVYIAAPYAARDGLRQFANELAAVGMDCTSLWLLGETPIKSGIGAAPDETQESIAQAAGDDLSHVERADAVVQFTGIAIEGLHIPGACGPSLHTGGRHVELGYALALKKPVIVVGPAENIFQRALCVTVPSWHRALLALIQLREDRRAMGRAS